MKKVFSIAFLVIFLIFGGSANALYELTEKDYRSINSFAEKARKIEKNNPERFQRIMTKLGRLTEDPDFNNRRDTLLFELYISLITDTNISGSDVLDLIMEDEKKEPGEPVFKEYESYIGTVVRVIDGDTIEVLYNDQLDTIRLIGIDAPEFGENQELAETSKLYLESRLLNKPARIEYDDSQGRTDFYGRTLAFVFPPSQTTLNQDMILEGHAKEYTYDTDYRNKRIFVESEILAMNASAGLWAEATESEKQEVATKVSQYREHITGPRGGCYYWNGNGNKTYVDREICAN